MYMYFGGLSKRGVLIVDDDECRLVINDADLKWAIFSAIFGFGVFGRDLGF